MSKTYSVLRILYSLFLSVMIPVYLYKYGPTNFFYFCDIALLITLVGVWTDSSLLISMCAIGIIIPQTLWTMDLIGELFGFPMVGITHYMFNSNTSLFLRLLSLFHVWLPFYVTYLVLKLKYDKRGLLYWTLTFWTLLFISYNFLPKPSKDLGLTPVNVNFVWGVSDEHVQTWMPEHWWLAIIVVVFPIICFLPTHFVLKKRSK